MLSIEDIPFDVWDQIEELKEVNNSIKITNYKTSDSEFLKALKHHNFIDYNDNTFLKYSVIPVHVNDTIRILPSQILETLTGLNINTIITNKHIDTNLISSHIFELFEVLRKEGGIVQLVSIDLIEILYFHGFIEFVDPAKHYVIASNKLMHYKNSDIIKTIAGNIPTNITFDNEILTEKELALLELEELAETYGFVLEQEHDIPEIG